MSDNFVEKLCELDATELRQLVIALCLETKNKDLTTQHLDMTAKMKSIDNNEAQGDRVENNNSNDVDPSEQGEVDHEASWGSPLRDDSDSDADDMPALVHEWGGCAPNTLDDGPERTISPDPPSEGNNEWCLPSSQRDNVWDDHRSSVCPASERDDDWGCHNPSEYPASEGASNTGDGDDSIEECHDCGENFIPTSQWYGDFYGERMPCHYHTGELEFNPSDFEREYDLEVLPSSKVRYNVQIMMQYPRAYVWTCCDQTASEAPCKERDWHTTSTTQFTPGTTASMSC